MKRMWLVLLFALPLGAMAPDDEAPKGFEYWNGQSFSELRKAMEPKAAADAHRVAAQKIADYPNDAAFEIHRVGDGAPELRETEVDVFFVQSGSGTLIVGGTLTGADTIAPQRTAERHHSGRRAQEAHRGRCGAHPRKDPAPSGAGWRQGNHLHRREGERLLSGADTPVRAL